MKSLAAVLASALLCCPCSVAYAATQTTTLAVPGMTCAACPFTVKTALSRVEGVSSVTVSYEKKQAIVTFDDTKASVAALMRATTNAGYPATPAPGASR